MAIQYLPQGRTAHEISSAIETAIRDGRLRPGDHLAPVRTLASTLGLAPGTVAAAYQRLGERGLVRARGRQGTVVADRPPVPTRNPVVLPEGVRNLADGNPDAALLPDLNAVLREVAAAGGEARLYGGPAKDDELVARARAGFDADGIPDGPVAVVGGAMDGVERVLAAHLRPGDPVVVEDPGYSGLLDLLPAVGLRPVPVPVDERGLRPDRLAEALSGGGVAAVVVVPRAQNPTGAAFDDDRARELREVLAGSPGVVVVEDDHAGAVAGVPYVSLCRDRERWAVVRSFAKSLGPDLRLAALTGDPVTVARVEGRQSLGTGWVSHVLQRSAARLLADPATARLLRRAAACYGERRHALGEALMAAGFPTWARSGFNFWVPVPEEEPVVRALLVAGFGVAAGARYRRVTGPGIRVTASALDPAVARDFVEALTAALCPSGRTRSG